MKALERRHQQAVIIARMMLDILAQARRDYRPKKQISTVFPDLLTLMAVRDNDGNGGTPLTVSAISKRIALPRSTTDRAVANLIKHGLIEKHRAGYRGRMAYVEARMNAEFFSRMVDAVSSAADQLHKL